MHSPLRTICSCLIVTVLTAGSAFSQGGYGTTFAGVVAIPGGVFGESFKTGFGGHVDFYMETESYLRVSVLLGFTRWSIDNEKINKQYTAAGGKGELKLEGRLNAFPLLIGVKLLSPPGGGRFYGVLEAGIYIYSGKVEGQKIENGVVAANIYEDKSDTPVAVNLGVGYLFPIKPDIALDLSARYHFVKRDTYYTYDVYGNTSEVSSDKYFSFALGLTYSFSTSSTQ